MILHDLSIKVDQMLMLFALGFFIISYKQTGGLSKSSYNEVS